MAKQITLDFTDGQWALIEEFYLVDGEDGQPITPTEETFKARIENDVRIRVTQSLQAKVAQEQANPFDV